MNVMELVRRVNSTYNQVNANLKILQETGVISDKHYGRLRVIWLNKESHRTLLLLKALRLLGAPEHGNIRKDDAHTP